MTSRPFRRHSGGSASGHGRHVPAVGRPTDQQSHHFPSFSRRSKFLLFSLCVAIMAGALISYHFLPADHATPTDWYVANAKNLMIVIASHTDDFCIAVGGQALMYQDKGAQVIVVMVSDVTGDIDSYRSGVSQGLFSADVEYDKLDVDINGVGFRRAVYSRNCAQYRISTMLARHKKWGFASILPKTPFPDGGGFSPQTVQDSYLVTLKDDLETQLSAAIIKSGATNVAFYRHDRDPVKSKHPDHAWAGKLGFALYGALEKKFSQIDFHQYCFYVYTKGSDPASDYVAVDVSGEYDDKACLYSEIFEFSGASVSRFLVMWNRVPKRGHDLWFRNELRKEVPDEEG
jgi:LmbE family N-acetylglucosaminyl deacetylase